MLGFLASLRRHALVDIQLKGRGISLQHDLQIDGVQGAYNLEFFVSGQVSHRTHFNIVMPEGYVTKGYFGLVVCSLPANGLRRLIVELDHRLAVQAFLVIFSVDRKQQDGSATPAVVARSQTGRVSHRIERIRLRRSLHGQQQNHRTDRKGRPESRSCPRYTSTAHSGASSFSHPHWPVNAALLLEKRLPAPIHLVVHSGRLVDSTHASNYCIAAH